MSDAEAAMNVFFDVDCTILGYDRSLRPHTHAVFERLIADGHTLYIWSGVGLRNADVEEAGLESLVAGIYVKPVSEFAVGLTRHSIPVKPDFVIDDHPAIVQYYGGLHVKRYEWADEPDEELLAIPALVAAMARRREQSETLLEIVNPLKDGRHATC
jgi:hypothetical protein